jgi:uncharacterized repeat protein (TIGR01451 family)
MSQLLRFGAAASITAVACGLASPAFAAQTVAGSSITNSVTVTYKVGGVSQNAVTASDTFTVDRKVNLTIVEEGSATTSVSPGQAAAVTSFLVSNLSNAPIDILFAASNLTGDNYDVANFKIYLDTDNSGGYTAGDTLVTYLDQVAAETSNIRVLVVADVPLGQTSGQVANIRLTGTAADALTIGSPGTALVQTTTANTSGVDTVFADTNANGNVARDGIDFAQDSYTILTAALTATKTSRLISDPLNGFTNPKAIPGATIEYCISVNNASGTPATAVDISDTLPSTTAYDPAFGVKTNGTTSAGTCTAGTTSGSYAGGVVTGTIPSVAVGETRNVVFRATVN